MQNPGTERREELIRSLSGPDEARRIDIENRRGQMGPRGVTQVITGDLINRVVALLGKKNSN